VSIAADGEGLAFESRGPPQSLRHLGHPFPFLLLARTSGGQRPRTSVVQRPRTSAVQRRLGRRSSKQLRRR
jgi:hypothetical protein